MATNQTTRAATTPNAEPSHAQSGWRRPEAALAFARELAGNRAFIAGLVIVSLLVYVHNALHTIDYQEFDEATYFHRGYLLAHGDVTGAGISDLGSSPLYIAYYALWYLLIGTSNVYPLVVTSSILLLGVSAYLLFGRIFHPVLSWAFALLVVIWSVPFAPNNLYIFAPACLWLSLAVLGRRPWQRGLAAALALLATLTRMEYLPVVLILLALLFLYETRLLRQRAVEWRELATVYAPAVVMLLVGLDMLQAAPTTLQGSLSYAIAWSYTDFYHWAHPAQFDPLYSYANPYALFTKDFGPLPQQASSLATLAAMTHNMPMMVQYLSFEASRLIAAFGTATLDAPQWRYDHLYTLSVLPNLGDTLGFLAGVAGFAVIVGLCAIALRRRHITVASALKGKTPILYGYISLIGLLPLLALVNPHQRFFMLYPLALLPVGLGLRRIGLALLSFTPRPATARSIAQGSVAVALLLTLFVYLPQPFAQEPPSGPMDAITLAFLRQHVPEGATIIGEPADSYADYLIGDGYQVSGIEAGPHAGSDGNVIWHILNAQPTLDNVYILFNHNIPYSGSNPWFTAWKALFPEIPITLVAQRQNPYLALYQLSPHLSARVRYLQLVRMTQQGQPGSSAASRLPRYDSVDFSAHLTWTGDQPQNIVTPQPWLVYGWQTQAIVMYPDLPGAWNIRAHTVTTTLPASWSGKTLVLAGAFAPWELNQPQADGTQLVFTIAGTSYHQVVQLPNTPNQQWRPILIPLPQTSGPLRLQVTVLPRNSLLWDDTLLSFLGVAATPPPVSVPADGTGH
ncbi:MAG TPA: hypothetical protein VF725_04300 [Ktedonobacterales bacterium]